MPRISVILPTYNRQQFLPEAVMSILTQTFSDLELIIADDGSTDATAQIVEDIQAKDERVKYLPLAHTGRSHARNKALEVASGEFIAFQDSDDISLPERLEMQIAVLQARPELGMVYCSTLYIDTDGNPLDNSYLLKPSDDLYQNILIKNYRAIGPMTAMVRAAVIEKIGGYDEKLDRFEDLDFYLRIAQQYPTQVIEEPLVKARLHDENAMPSQQPEEVLRNLDFFAGKVSANDANRTPARLLKASLARLYLIYGNETAKFFPYRGYAPFFRRAFALYPNLKQGIWFMLAAAGLTQRIEKYLRDRRKTN